MKLLILQECQQAALINFLGKWRLVAASVPCRLKLPKHNTHYLFVEDFDGNKICLDFPLNNA